MKNQGPNPSILPIRPPHNPSSRKRRKTTNAPSKHSEGLTTLHHPDAAGIDIGAEEMVVAVPADRATPCVRTFKTFTTSLDELVSWVLECRVKTVALESTGNYWITVYDKLIAAGIDVFLVNARHVPKGPARKTDVCDAQWLQQMHTAGLLRKSFRPGEEIVPIRYLMRHRSDMVRGSSERLLLMQKVLNEMNLKIHHVFSDIDGMSAQTIIRAILAGERNPVTLAALRDHRCRSSVEDVIEALRGDYRTEYLFVLQQHFEAYEKQQKDILACDEQLTSLIAKVNCAPPEEKLKHEPKQHRAQKNALMVPIFTEGYRFYGVDLSGIPGVGANLIGTLIAEIGTREQLREAFTTGDHFASWLGLCPDNRVSGGKILKSKTRKVSNRLTEAFRMAAFGLSRSDNEVGQLCRRLKGRLGKAEGITATAHKLARIVYGVIRHQKPYDAEEAFKQTAASLARKIKNLHKQASALGLELREAA